ncbi:MAG: Uma2 family endonuclease [Nostoc sp. EfeVER01]|uniref:Uma2 family endonuclease n=1 Tax=unclassified Nostoc TaxID=2593658 RepID=UPI002AD4E455|nr:MULTISPECIES: Uma2 family endonuclease [unclassified Nostoc]MDZ7944206.1 Uma2 family endonuclease [Nostoc sp. EfeVER01]MDZ7996181.1 Uma2 family endonuclease [Nostoc sp. EspVER01]
MIQAIHKLVTFEDFAAWRPEGGRYELHDGVIVEMAQPVGDHEDVVGFLALNISIEIGRQKLPYFIPKTVLVKPFEGESAYSPDILIINRPNLVNEPLWKKESTVSQAASIPLVIEVVSTNWRDDYYKKLADYEAIGIPEYWIIDYAAIGARKFIGNPKLPTISIYELIDGEYQVTQFKGDTHIVSPTFPELNLTAEQIFQAGGVQIDLTP